MDSSPRKTKPRRHDLSHRFGQRARPVKDVGVRRRHVGNRHRLLSCKNCSCKYERGMV